MKTKLYNTGIIIITTLITCSKSSAQNANKALSNLTSPTAVNVDLVPDNNTRELGSKSKGWKHIYVTGSFYLDGDKFIHNSGTGNTFVGDSAGAVISSGINNTSMGYHSLLNVTTGNYNVANGYSALQNNIGGVDNTAVGYKALQENTSGSDNVAEGLYALVNNTTGYSNVAIGVRALKSNKNGHNLVAVGDSALFNQSAASGYFANTALGSKALFSNTEGSENTATGFSALYSNIGAQNTAVGNQSLYSNTSGGGNTAVGYFSLNRSKTGILNTAIGFGSGLSVTTGNENTFLGPHTDCGSGGILSNSTAIGYAATVNGSNKVVMGNSFIVSIGGYVNWTNFSDGRYKQNVKQNVPGLEFINKLNPVTYTLNVDAIESKLHGDQEDLKSAYSKTVSNLADDLIMKQAMNEKSRIVYTGFVAQDVEKAAQSLHYDFSGVDKPQNDNQSFYGLRYGDFVVPLVKAVQELSKINDNKDAKIADLEQRLAKLESIMKVQHPTSNLNSISLEQNIPNPFSNTTTINYSLPSQYSSAKIIITDNNGKVLKQLPVSGAGKNTLHVNASIFSSGGYQYSLYVDGKFIDAKKMVLTK